MYQTSETVIASVTLTKKLPNRRSFSTTAQLVHLHANARPYFSVTSEERNLRRIEENQVESCGCMHDEVLRHFPELAPIVALHLSDDDGTPMHVVANAAYHLGFTAYKEDNGLALPNLAAFARLWRLSENSARDIYQDAAASAHPVAYLTMTAEMQADRWMAEAMYAADLIVNLRLHQHAE